MHCRRNVGRHIKDLVIYSSCNTRHELIVHAARDSLAMGDVIIDWIAWSIAWICRQHLMQLRVASMEFCMGLQTASHACGEWVVWSTARGCRQHPMHVDTIGQITSIRFCRVRNRNWQGACKEYSGEHGGLHGRQEPSDNFETRKESWADPQVSYCAGNKRNAWEGQCEEHSGEHGGPHGRQEAPDSSQSC